MQETTEKRSEPTLIRAVVVEDEKKSRETLTGLIRLFCKNVEIVAEADGMQTGIEAVRKHLPDIIFLDIQMPDGSGFRLLEELAGVDFEVIFTTAYDQFAIKAFKYSAIDYLLKPIFPDDLMDAVRKAEHKMKTKQNARKGIEVLLDNVRRAGDQPPKIVLSTLEQLHVVGVDDIIRCESDNYYTVFFFTNGKKLIVSRTLKENEELLSEYNFIRPHKSHLINVKYIKGFLKSEHGLILMTDGSRVPVSRRKREYIMEILSSL
ncbi:MAG: response regulator transcription factor [Bacteroidales bacterium]|nr:response regulator transcription factor [Bacteroidales bacterium]